MKRLSDEAGAFSDFVGLTESYRTDITEEPPSIPIKERLYKEQEGLCNGCYSPFEI
jgi:site-specific DNA-methyltransferase (adenine-specific)